MQLKIYQKLNQILILFIASVILITVILFLNSAKLGDNKVLAMCLVILYSIGGFFGFKMLENNWDKRMIQKMAIKGQIALANITSAKPFMLIKDSSIRVYRLWEINAVFYDQDMKKQEITFYEKMNKDVREIPNCTVYITHNPDKPEAKFIIQNVIISHIPALMPVVSKYESNKNLRIKYMDVFYNDGIVIRPFKESIKINQELKDMVIEPEELKNS